MATLRVYIKAHQVGEALKAWKEYGEKKVGNDPCPFGLWQGPLKVHEDQQGKYVSFQISADCSDCSDLSSSPIFTWGVFFTFRAEFYGRRLPFGSYSRAPTRNHGPFSDEAHATVAPTKDGCELAASSCNWDSLRDLVQSILTGEKSPGLEWKALQPM